MLAAGSMAHTAAEAPQTIQLAMAAAAVFLMNCFIVSSCHTDSAETDASGKAYQQEYFTNEAASDAETIRADAAPREETAQVDADEAQCNAMLEYARCLYPDYQADHAELSEKLVDGTAYLFAAIADKDGTTFCTIAYNAQKDIYYLYDREMNQLIPIEYDEYGVRLVS